MVQLENNDRMALESISIHLADIQSMAEESVCDSKFLQNLAHQESDLLDCQSVLKLNKYKTI